MADEKIGISVEVKGTGAGIKSVKELKNEVQKLEETASKADFGSDEFKKATEEANKLKGKMTEISGAESTKMTTSLKGLQQEYKKLKVALSEAANPEEFKRLSKELNDVEGKIGDINDAASIATGSGIEQMNKGLSLVGEGFRNFDFEKIKIGFKGLGTAMNAIPLLLIVSGITMLIEKFGIFEMITDAVVNVIYAFTDAIGLTNKADEKAAAQIIENAEKVQKAKEEQYNAEIKKAQAAGQSTKELEVEKLKSTELSIAKQVKAMEILQVQKGKLNDEEQKNYDELQVNLLKASSDREAQEIANNKEKVDKINAYNTFQSDVAEELRVAKLSEREKEIDAIRKASAEKLKELDDKHVYDYTQSGKEIEEQLRKNKETEAQINQLAQIEINKVNAKYAEDKKKQAEIDGEARYQAAKDEQQRMADEEAVIIPEQKQAIAQTELEINAAKNAELLNQSSLLYEADTKKAMEAANQKAKGQAKLFEASFKASKDLSDAIFAIQIGNAKKGSAEELKLKKQQFNVNKAFSVTQATIDGVKAVQGVLAQSAFYGPFTVPIAIATGVSAAANVAKIAAAKFDGGGASSGGGGAAPQIGSTSLPTPPTINNPNNNTSTMFDAQGNNLGQSNEQRTSQQPIKVFVTETDISDIQNRANKLKTQTTI
jgi:hypothetical protein